MVSTRIFHARFWLVVEPPYWERIFSWSSREALALCGVFGPYFHSFSPTLEHEIMVFISVKIARYILAGKYAAYTRGELEQAKKVKNGVAPSKSDHFLWDALSVKKKRSKDRFKNEAYGFLWHYQNWLLPSSSTHSKHYFNFASNFAICVLRSSFWASSRTHASWHFEKNFQN